jgi:hypothetical protein
MCRLLEQAHEEEQARNAELVADLEARKVSQSFSNTHVCTIAGRIICPCLMMPLWY